MLSRLQQKIADLRQAPEDVRLKAAVRYTIIGGLVILALWLMLFLPLQLRSAF